MTPALEEKIRFYNNKWYPGWKAEEGKVIKWLKMGVQDLPCHIFPEAIRILREYGDLIYGNICFTPEEPNDRIDHEEWLWWEWLVGEALFPIGYTLGELTIYAVSRSGKIYSKGISTHYCGASFEAFLEEGRYVLITTAHWPEELSREMEKWYSAVYGTG